MTIVEKVKNIPKLKRRTRVAAYARVSSDKDAMLHSLSNQVSYYSKMIQSHVGWKFVGVYADEGLTGTKEDRDEFVRLIEDAKAGKIDLIITKAISRFARNTMTLLQTARDLKAIGVDIYFEEQNLHTISAEGEMVLTLLASVAQEESRQVSENQKWRIKREFSQGIPWGGTGCYGYRIVDKKYVVVPEEAEVVKKIFDLYLSGMGYTMIAKVLNKENVISPEGVQWRHEVISRILENINYTGNLLLQKTFIENHLTKRKKINKGELQQYYVENDHEPIISMELFEEVAHQRQIRREQHNSDGHHKHYPLTGMLVCAKCGYKYLHKVTKYNTHWICATFKSIGKGYCDSKQVQENALYEAINTEFGYKEFDEKDFKSKVKRILVKDGNILTLQFHDGTEKDIVWQDPSRRDSWTDEMKEKARQQTLRRYR